MIAKCRGKAISKHIIVIHQRTVVTLVVKMWNRSFTFYTFLGADLSNFVLVRRGGMPYLV